MGFCFCIKSLLYKQRKIEVFARISALQTVAGFWTQGTPQPGFRVGSQLLALDSLIQAASV